MPYDPTLRRPGDRRRFCFYAERRGVSFEIADPGSAYDVVVLSAGADITTWVHYRPGRAKIVYELLDSYLAVSPFELKSLLRGPAKFLARETAGLALSYRRAMENMCRRADAVVCSTEEQRAQILELTPNVHPILDFHGHLIGTRKHDYARGDALHLVWEGLPENLRGFEGILPALDEVGRDCPVFLHLVTDLRYGRLLGRYLKRSTEKRARRLFDRIYLYQWNETMLAPIATACDLAVIPISEDDRLMQAKPENKLLLFWRMGVPTVASATPAYVRTMEACGLDMACHTTEDWVATVGRYGGDEASRRGAGERGREYSEQEHGEERLLERWDRTFASLS
ncbi:MAG: hypothetical protein M3450_00195 [Actinomycetota bacterium]|nr:hypothetical protein [Actinomycetota bacterium]